MSDNMTEAFAAPIRAIAQEAVQAEMETFRDRLVKVCQDVVESAFQGFLTSPQLREAVREEIGQSGGVTPQAGTGDMAKTLERFLIDNGAELFRTEAVQVELNTVILEKAKELFKRSMFSGSLDIKKAVTRVVENILEKRGVTGGDGGGTGAGGADVSEAVSRHLKENLKGTVSDAIGSEIRAFLSSDEMKELLDTKFRAIDLYLKTDLIPKIVKREITKAQEQT